MDEKQLDQIGQLAEQLDNSLFAYKTLPLSLSIHLEGLSGTMEEVRDKLAEIYKENGGTEDLNIQA